MASVSLPEDLLAVSVGNLQQLHNRMTVLALLFITGKAHYNYILVNRDTWNKSVLAQSFYNNCTNKSFECYLHLSPLSNHNKNISISAMPNVIF